MPAPDHHPVFYIPATASLQERRPRILKHGDTFAVFDHNGDIVQGPGSAEGLFHADTRHLSLCALTLDGRRPLLLSSTLRADNATLTCDLTNQDVVAGGELLLEHDIIHIRRTKFLWDGGCFERLALSNYSLEVRNVQLELGLAADFADLFEVRGSKRGQRGTLHEPTIGGNKVVFSYTGRDDVCRRTCVRFEPAPTELHSGGARFQLTLAPQSGCIVYVEVDFQESDADRQLAVRFRSGLRRARQALRHARRRMARVDSSNDIFNELTHRTVADL